MMLVASDRITSSRPSIRRIISRRDADGLAVLCRRAERRGAAWLDLAPGFLKQRDLREVWSFLVETAERACSLTVMLDAPDARSLEVALSCCSRPPVLNMASAAEDRLGPVLDLAAHHHLKVVGGLFDDKVPTTVEGRLELAALIMTEAESRGIEPYRILLDPIAMPLASPGGERHAAAVLGLLRQLPLAFPETPRTILGLSNLTTGTARAAATDAAVPMLFAAFGAGLDVVLLDTDNDALIEAVQLCHVLDGEGIYAPGA